MAQGGLPFQYQKESTGVGMTALAGLSLYLELTHVMGLVDAIRQHWRPSCGPGSIPSMLHR